MEYILLFLSGLEQRSRPEAAFTASDPLLVLSPRGHYNHGMNIFTTCSELLEAGHAFAIVTVIEASRGTPGKEGFKLLVADDGRLFGTVGGGALEHRAIEEARQVLKRDQGRILSLELADLGMVCGGKVTLVLEPVKSHTAFAVFGGGHVGRALSPILESLRFRVTVFDCREEMVAELKKNGPRSVLVESYDNLDKVKALLLPAKYCFIATHSHEYDYAILKQLLRFSDEYRYIGLIGSTRKVAEVAHRLQNDGIALPAYLFAPVGLDLGGNTAEEIAVAVAAEVIARRHDTPAAHLRSQIGDAVEK